jgi:ABC-type branched-subunit amino acid transport system substrate-binding protein
MKSIGFGMVAAWAMLASAWAETPGVTATDIKIGQNAAFSGPASVYGEISTAESGYFKMINEQGGVNGRQLNLIALDDGYSPPKTIEVIRKLIEDEQVAFLFQTLGTAPNTAIRKYYNAKKVPDIWIGSGASEFVSHIDEYKWGIPFQPSYRLEGAMLGKYVLKEVKEPKIGVIYQNDDLGRDYVTGLHDALGADYDKLVVKTVSYEITDATIDSQLVALQQAGANVVFDASTPKFSAMSIRKVADLDWHPLHVIDSNGALMNPALKSAGFDKSVGVVTAQYLKDPTDPGWAEDPGMKAFMAWRAKYAPQSDPSNPVWAYGYNMAQALVIVLRQAGRDVTRESILNAATHFPADAKLDMVLPGIKLGTTPEDYRAMKSMRLARFDGTRYHLLPE